MHYHQLEFIKYYAKDAESVLIFGDRMTNLPDTITKTNKMVSEFFASKFDCQAAEDDFKKKSTYKPKKTFDLIIDLGEMSIVEKAIAYNMLKSAQNAAHEETVFIHFSPVKGHFPGLTRNSNLSDVFWGEILANDSILESSVVAAHHNQSTGRETYIAYKKPKRFPNKKKFIEAIEKV